MDSQAKEEAILNIIKTRDQNKLKVLLLNDRPYYNREHLFLHTPVTLFNYFRTLTFWQVFSWVFWIFLFEFMRNKSTVVQQLTCRKMLPPAGVAAALFLLGLGLVYVFRNQTVEDFTEIYPEYYKLLFLAGGALLVLSAVTAFFRLKKNN
jgi:hypothetical protein